ncbi:SoxR reducing system RseC family protein [Mariniphaga anaerophila]|uniref:SoxR reducing system RseC family protein n=1 Tax=Mariniphaga anaerophila TaxID=1484053 RepID=UPI001587BD3C|nr:SoxR reducing system RseC family protein [Mariniphaga anaerophila]
MIRHKGFVKRVTGTSLIVSIVNKSACSSCHANGACSVADFQEKEIEIPYVGEKHVPGQVVTILFRESAGFKALFYGYIFPFLLVMLTLILVSVTTKNEALAGLSALGILAPYYITLYFFRQHLKKVFKFELEEIN